MPSSSSDSPLMSKLPLIVAIAGNALILVVVIVGLSKTNAEIGQLAQTTTEKLDHTSVALADATRTLGDRLDRLNEKTDLTAAAVASLAAESASRAALAAAPRPSVQSSGAPARKPAKSSAKKPAKAPAKKSPAKKAKAA